MHHLHRRVITNAFGECSSGLSESYSVGDLVGKSLTVKRDVKAYDLPDTHSQVKAIWKKGSNIFLYSWINNPEGVWFMYESALYPGSFDYILYTPGTIKMPAGVKTIEQQIKDEQEANKSWTDKLFDNINLLVIGGLAIAAGAVLFKTRKRK